jgi:hypothetical protein
MTRSPANWDIDGPIQPEVSVVWLQADVLDLAGPPVRPDGAVAA